MHPTHVTEPDEPIAYDDQPRVIVGAAKQVARPIFFSLTIIIVSFVPVFLLEAQEGRMFRPLAFTKTSAMVLAHLFPRDASALMALARESGESRIWAGIHYPMDIAAGQQLAERVAGRAIERAKGDGAERVRP